MKDIDLPIDEVGEWAKEKHERLRKYVDASRAARRKYVQGSGGASYIDLYCGSGSGEIKGSGERIDGSPLVAFKEAKRGGVPFSEIHLADISEEKCKAAQRRIVAAGGEAFIYPGTAEASVSQLVKRLNPFGLHFAFLDPFNLQDLPFIVIKALAQLKRMDLLIHVSALDLQRNLGIYTAPGDNRLEQFAPGWRASVNLNQSEKGIRAAILAHWAGKLESLGLPPALHAELVTGTENQRLYWLIFASRSNFAKRLWDEIRAVSGQKSLF